VEEGRVEELWQEVWTLLEKGETEDAVRRALAALNDEGDAPELRYLLGVGLMDADEPEAAIPELESAVKQEPEWPDARSALAWALFRVCRFADATAQVVEAIELDSDNPDAHQLHGLLAERAGNDGTALTAFAQARRLDPERYPDPYEMDEDEFLAVAQGVVAELEPPVRQVLEETSFFVQPFPAEELLRDADPPLDPMILGLFVGRSLLERSVTDVGDLPNTMYLFQRNLERVVTSREELEEEIRITVLHEIGHHLGWGEEELEARGLA
jgi:predicted Zn-dependent protease with MMP-like domain